MKKRTLVIANLLLAVILLVCFFFNKPKVHQPLRFIPILPSKIRTGDTSNISYREDYYAIANLDRSDSTALFNSIAQHTCNVIDSINLTQYDSYHIEYYEHGIYMNDSTMSSSVYNQNSIYRADDELWHVADEIDGFVCWVIYHKGELDLIKWYKSGRSEGGREIKVTSKVRDLFQHCNHNP